MMKKIHIAIKISITISDTLKYTLLNMIKYSIELTKNDRNSIILIKSMIVIKVIIMRYLCETSMRKREQRYFCE